MATTTTNFGFDIPTSSDLVKNGATQIALLGQDIDTTFAGLTVNAQTGTTYTAVKADGLNAIVTMDNASANTFRIPTDATYNFPTGTTLLVYQKGAGITTINAVTSGTTTIVSAGATAAAPVLARYKSAACIKIAANSWIVLGGIA
jgi:outer membrane usher protein FimD/PapC